MCEGCKWYLYDSSTDASDCMKAEDMTEQDFETYFIDDRDGCPCPYRSRSQSRLQ